MAHRIQGMIFTLLGIVGLFDTWRINDEVRPTANFDGIGPDRYLAIISAILIVLGLALAFRSKIAGETSDWSELRRWPPVDYLVIAIILAVFIWAIPVIGFSAACLLFFMATFKVLGDWSWPRTAVYSLAMAIFIYAVFIYFADLPMPKTFDLL